MAPAQNLGGRGRVTWEVRHADCLDAMREMDEASVDAIVTDPPYGLEFMGKEWDRIGDVRQRGDDDFQAADDKEPFGRVRHGGTPSYRAGADTQRASQEWHQAWATEALRVLRPGGHLLAFGGTRTYHRLACAVEDAGFEIRDSLIWLYGSGFPKSLDVSKAIDKRPGVHRHAEFAAHLRDRMAVKGYTNTFDVAEAVIGKRTGAVANWQKYQWPEFKWWPRLRELLDLDPKWGEVLAEAEREKVGENPRKAGWFTAQDGHDLTAPATPEAQRWQGWGTALKPAHEPIVCAQKPLTTVPLVPIVREVTERLEAYLWSLSPARFVKASSRSSRLDLPEDQPASARWLAVVLTTPESVAWSALMDTCKSPEAASTLLNIASSWNAISGVLLVPGSTSTTSMASATTTALRTLNSWLLTSTPAAIVEAASRHGGLWSDARTAGESSSDGSWMWPLTPRRSAPDAASWTTANGILSTLASIAESISLPLRVTGGATAQSSALGEQTTPSAGLESEPVSVAERCIAPSAASSDSARSAAPTSARSAHEPVVVARKPLIGTVAQNVTEHGTGALNIDGCRIEGTPHAGGAGMASSGRTLNQFGEYEPGPNAEGNPTGRWPANVAISHLESCEPIGERRVKGHVLGKGATFGGAFGNGEPVKDGARDYADPDGLETVTAWRCQEGCPVAELDWQSGELKSGQLLTHHKRGGESQLGTFNIRDRTGEPCNFGGDTGGASRFFYTAKASRAERNAGLGGFEERRLGGQLGQREGKRMGRSAEEGAGVRESVGRNAHPT